MWIMLNNAFFSIIDPAAEYDGGGHTGTHLLVRARFRGDIERVFPRTKVTATPDRDYAYRALIDRKTVALKIAEQITSIDYLNFKGSVEEKWRHDDYMRVWTVMHSAQDRQAGRGRRRGRRGRDNDLFHFA